jgi:hypothetical protein
MIFPYPLRGAPVPARAPKCRAELLANWQTWLTRVSLSREKLREQNALSEEIVEAMNGVSVGNQIDDAELDEELEALQQEQLDEQMLGTGHVPVSDAVQRLPAAANGERKIIPCPCLPCACPFEFTLTCLISQRKGCRGGRRGSRAQKAPGGDGHVIRKSGPNGNDHIRSTRVPSGVASRGLGWQEGRVVIFACVQDRLCLIETAPLPELDVFAPHL